MTALDPSTAKPAIYNFAGLGAATTAEFSKADDGQSATVKNWPVFKAGTFADSFGFVETWTVEHLAQMVSHFELLRAALPDIPVRADHGRSIDKVKGYVTALRVQDGFLLADALLTEPDAVEKWERGTYRGRSSEIGFYETNDAAAYYPVFLGVAFVDIPAVEGLFSKQTDQTNVRYFTEASSQMTTPKPSDTAPGIRPGSPPVTTTVTVSSTGGAADEQPLIGGPSIYTAPPPVTIPPTGATESAPAPTPALVPVPVSAPQAVAPTDGAQKFTINGEVLDLNEIQTRLAAAKAFEQEQTDAARSAFAAKLVDEKKLGAPQREAMAELAKSLNPDQFTKLQALYEAAPELSLLANHIDGVTNPTGGAGAQKTPEQQALATAQETVRMHERSGMSPDDIKKTKSYQIVQAAQAASN